MTYRFKPLPDITAYELAILVQNLRFGEMARQGIFAADEEMQGDSENPIPEYLRRHFEKLPKITSPIRSSRKP